MFFRPADTRGKAHFGWLDSRHSFSFGHYFDPAHMGFGTLRVINEDWVAPGRGFDTHGHQDMEILTIVLDGALEHRDSIGNGSVMRPGDVQRMTAGTGIRHSEFNPSDSEPVHLLQIWILPESEGLEPGYEQKTFPAAERAERLCLVASRTGRDGSLVVHQDADVYLGSLSKGSAASFDVRPGRQAWLQVARGGLTVNGQELDAGDGLGVRAAGSLTLTAGQDAELVLFDLAA